MVITLVQYFVKMSTAAKILSHFFTFTFLTLIFAGLVPVLITQG